MPDLTDLVADVLHDGSGGLPASVYETARLVALVPWLPGHEARLAWLRAGQHADGSWGGPGGWALVPTLSATHALLGIDDSAAARGLAAARALIAETAVTGTAGTVVGFLIIPALIGDINAKLDAPHQLALPAGCSDAVLTAVRDGGWRHPLAGHYLEIFGPEVVRSPEVELSDGNVGCSVAATAAWLGARPPADRTHPAVGFLTRSQARLGGPVPAMTSIVYYERGWIIGQLATSGFDAGLLAPLAAGLPSDAGHTGLPTAPGFAEDAETTSVVLHGLAQLGDVREPEALRKYDAGTHFMSTIPEKWPSTSTNAHIMQVFGGYLRTAPPDADWYADAVTRIAAWLAGRQATDGSWTDRWHISPVFATTCCLEALHLYAGPEYTPAVRQGLDWLLTRQQEDGSWGGTAEETAYALRALVLTGAGATTAIERGRQFLTGPGATPVHPALWVGKELYTPTHLVRAAVLGALRLIEPVGGRP